MLPSLRLGRQFFQSVQSMPDLQFHPLLLPLALISKHLSRVSELLMEK